MPLQLVVLLVSFGLSIIGGVILIPVLARLKFGQVVRNDGPESHLKKMGTPTMGGIIFLLALTLVCAYYGIRYPLVFPALVATLLFGFIGFIDDYIKIVLKRSKGLSARYKMLGLLIVATGFAIYLQFFYKLGSEFSIPFTNIWLDFSKNINVPFLHAKMGIEWLYIPFLVFIMLATTNSVNLTDGLDGLAAGVGIIIMLFFTMVSMAIENTEMIIFCAGMLGTMLGFLAFNMYPAKIFMGDTGSLAIGGAIAVTAIMLKVPFVLLIVAGVCVVEALSVMIQVYVFKKTGKRVFKMAPIHHHLELSGWSENKVVTTLWGMTLLLCFVGLISLKYAIF
jgi:phospho-N-acetylmuramoyl-pentapeptide-transferase